jgi:uncharacterized repeat protein (TIGR03803 family)
MRRILFSLVIFFLTLAAGSSSARAQSTSQSVLYSFCTLADCADGGMPSGPLTLAADGNFYGTTFEAGGENIPFIQDGTAYKITPDGALTTLHSFCGYSGCPDGIGPNGGMIQGTDGNFYGTTIFGGANNQPNEGNYGDGTVFKLTPAGKLTTLYSFCNTGGDKCTDGQIPYFALVQGADGDFYGATLYGGGFTTGNNHFGDGTIFKVSATGTFTSLHQFTGGDDGALPYGALTQGSDGNFYGVTAEGGSTGFGTLFKITSSGTLTTIYTFKNGQDSEGPDAGLVQGDDGDFYGTTGPVPNGNDGTFFKVSAGGAYTYLGEFAKPSSTFSTYSILSLAGDGNFYGTTPYSGVNNSGTVYRVTPAGTFTTLYSFCTQTDCVDGSIPFAGVIPGADGSLYGTTLSGGTNQVNGMTGGDGTFYRVKFSTALPAPIQLTLSETSIKTNNAVTLSWKVLNALAITTQQCYASVQGGAAGAGTWTGRQSGTLSGTTYSGSAKITPTIAGSYIYALTCGGTMSGFATLTVEAVKSASTTDLSAAPNPATVGQNVSLSARVTGSGGIPTGNVTFSVNGLTLDTVPLSGSGVAIFAASTDGQTPGSYPVIATYGGSASYDSSASKALTVTLNKAATDITLTANPTSVTPPGSVTLKATVSRLPSGAKGIPTGTVVFAVGTVTLGTARLNGSGVATLNASSQGQQPGDYPVTAKYAGDASDASSTSTAETVTVK